MFCFPHIQKIQKSKFTEWKNKADERILWAMFYIKITITNNNIFTLEFPWEIPVEGEQVKEETNFSCWNRIAWTCRYPGTYSYSCASLPSMQEGWVAHYAQGSTLLQQDSGTIINSSKDPLALEAVAYASAIFQLALTFSPGNSRASAHVSKDYYWKHGFLQWCWTPSPRGWHT